jgi:hypothetical protein
MTSEGLGQMFEGDTCAGKFPLVSMVGRAEGFACADPVTDFFTVEPLSLFATAINQ